MGVHRVKSDRNVPLPARTECTKLLSHFSQQNNLVFLKREPRGRRRRRRRRRRRWRRGRRRQRAEVLGRGPDLPRQADRRAGGAGGARRPHVPGRHPGAQDRHPRLGGTQAEGGDAHRRGRAQDPGREDRRLPLPPPRAQDQLHRPGRGRREGLWLHLRVAGERAQVLRDKDGEGGRAGGGGHEGPLPGGLRAQEEGNRRGEAATREGKRGGLLR